MASNRWHKLNNTACDIERLGEKIVNAKVHCMTHKNSSVKQIISDLEQELEQLHIELERQCEEWIQKIKEMDDVENG